LYEHDEYIHDVLEDKIVVCQTVRQAVERAQRDREAKEYLWNEKEAQRVCRFFSIFLRHSKGKKWAGRPFELSPWQAFIVREIFGWYREDGCRRYQRAYMEVPRRNGKSTLAAGIGLYLLVGDQEEEAEVYTAASKIDQARIIHGQSISMVKASAGLSKYCDVLKNNISCMRLGGKYIPISSQAAGNHGLNVSGALIDELHCHKNRDTYDVLDSATGSRDSPIIFSTTTAGHDKFSICGEIHDATKDILSRTYEDNSMFGYISSADAEDESDGWTTPEVWAKANPNYGISFNTQDIKEACNRARRTPAQENIFKRLRLNLWTEQADRWIPLHEWDRCNLAPLPVNPPKGTPLYAGLDMGSTRDFTALVIAWGRDPINILPKFWCPQAAQEERPSFEKNMVRDWIKRGLVTETPGNVTDYEPLVEYLDYISNDVVELVFDTWGSNDVIQRLEGVGYRTTENAGRNKRRQVVKFRQGDKTMDPACNDFENLVMTKRLNHAGNVVLKWMMKNTSLMIGPTGLVKPDKRKRIGKIDGIVASIMATARLQSNPAFKKSCSGFEAVSF
jgi:phage terminase large subunit-like protein